MPSSDLLDALDEAFRINDVGRLGDELAGQRHAFEHRRPALRIALARVLAAADDHDLPSVSASACP